MPKNQAHKIKFTKNLSFRHFQSIDSFRVEKNDEIFFDEWRIFFASEL